MTKVMSSLPGSSAHATSRSDRRAVSRRRRARGFTMAELLVATLAGLTVSLGAFAFARASTRTFQQEIRLSDATSNVTIGFRRLVADIERSGYLSTPNIQRDYYTGNRVCLQPNNSTFPTGIQSLAAIRIEQGSYTGPTGKDSPISTQSTPSGSVTLSPERLTLSGSYASVEQFAVRAVDTSSGSPIVYLDPLSGAAMRTDPVRAAGNVPTLKPWANIFLPGRILRLVDRQGYQHFGVIQSVAISNGAPAITLTNIPGLYMRGSVPPTVANPGCQGIELGVGALANVVNRIRYEVRDLKNVTDYAALYPTPPVIADDDKRWELVRYEIDTTGNLIAGTTELVAPYAIDLRTALTVINGGVGPANLLQPNPTLTTVDFGDLNTGTKWAREVPTGSPTTLDGPERIRSVRVRLSVRSREPDRTSGLADPDYAGLPDFRPLLRYQIPGTNHYARVRTLQAEVSLSNQTSVFY